MGQAPAESEVDVHAEQRLTGLRDDLRQPCGARGIAAGDRIRETGALQEHDRLEDVGVHCGAGGDLVDQAAVCRYACGGLDRPTGALDEQHVRFAGGGALHEVAHPAGVVGKRIFRGCRAADPRQRQRRRPAAGEQRHQHGDCADDQHAAGEDTSQAHLTRALASCAHLPVALASRARRRRYLI
jgi:hypothetical protein